MSFFFLLGGGVSRCLRGTDGRGRVSVGVAVARFGALCLDGRLGRAQGRWERSRGVGLAAAHAHAGHVHVGVD